MLRTVAIAVIFMLLSCARNEGPDSKPLKPSGPYVVVLGIAQDAGYPQAGCAKNCCKGAWAARRQKMVSSLALVDPLSGQRWLFDCTPDFPKQMALLDSLAPAGNEWLSGIFLTHAHMGHYTGLMHLGREAINSKSIQVYAMPDMREFLQSNGPWIQLVTLQNIELVPIKEDTAVSLNERISVTAFTVPHRDEFSETVGYRIKTANSSLVFIPDIDKWQKWDRSILDMVKENDHIFIDGTFYAEGEIPGRNMDEIPHPFISESMKLFEHLPPSEKQKIHFIHLNHTNPALQDSSAAQKEIYGKGYCLAREMQIIAL
ncbi:MAG: MBL fold metallo-hydrolase [Bacteroidota bacterium]